MWLAGEGRDGCWEVDSFGSWERGYRGDLEVMSILLPFRVLITTTSEF